MKRKLVRWLRESYNPPVHLLLPLLSSLLYVFAAMFVKQAAEGGVGPWRASFLCNWITAGLFLLLLAFGGELPDSALGYVQPAVVALLFVGGQLFTFLALDKGDVSVATPVMGVKVILVAVFSVLFMDLAVRPQLWVAAVLSCVGIAFLQRAPGGGDHGRLGRTIVLSLIAASCYASFDVLVTKWSPSWGLGRFLPVMMLFAGVFSFGFVLLFKQPLKAIPKASLRAILIGSTLMGLQALVLVSTLAHFNDATAINVIYTMRGLWSVLLVWVVGHWFANQEHQLGAKVMRGRLVGAGFLSAAVVLVFV